MDKYDLRDAWLRAEAREMGFEVSDDDSFTLEIDTYGEGCCDMCASVRSVLLASTGRYHFEVSL